MLAALLLGVPIAFSLASAGLIGIWLIKGNWSLVLVVLRTVPFHAVGEYTFTTVPMFILMAYLSASSGLAKDLYTCAANWLSNVRGGLAIATVFACGIFGAMSGASVAAAAAMASISVSNMRRYGYSDELAAGSVSVGATLDILIPPSVPMVIYGVMTETSIAELLVAGVVPGIILGVLLVLCIYVWVILRPSHAPTVQRVSMDERWRSILRIWPSILLIVFILIVLYQGIATPTEVGALGAFMAAVIGVAMRRLTWAGALGAMKNTIRTTSMIFLIFIGANVFGYYMTMSQVPQHLVAAIMETGINRWLVVIGIIVGYFLISMFMDEIPLLIITLPLSFPLITSLGFDPVWFGVLSMMMIAMGLVFPPVGMIAFVVSATANVPLQKVYRGTSVLIIAIILATVVLMVFPQTALWLPSRMH